TSLAYTAPPVSSHLSLHDALPICEGADRPARPEEGACRRDDRERGGALGELKHHLRALALGEREDLADGTREESHEHRRREDLRSEEHTSELQSRENLVCRLLLEK